MMAASKGRWFNILKSSKDKVIAKKRFWGKGRSIAKQGLIIPLYL